MKSSNFVTQAGSTIAANSPHRIAILTLAILVTSIAMLQAAVSAVWRGNSEIEKFLLASLFGFVALSVHVLPAILETRLKWAVVIFGLLGAGYNQVSFFAQVYSHGNTVRLQNSTEYRAIQRQIEAAEEAIQNIHSRPVTEIASELAIASQSRQRHELSLQLSEAKREIVLRNELRQLNTQATTSRVTEQEDPVTRLLAITFAVRPELISLFVSVMCSILVEVIGIALWYELFRSRPEDGGGCNGEVQLEKLRLGIESGECQKTVSSIRVFLACSQKTAMKLRRAIVSYGNQQGGKNDN